MTVTLAAVDADQYAEAVLAWGATITRLTGGTAAALHVGPTARATTIQVHDLPLRERYGPVAEGIIAASRDPGVDTLVIGHGAGTPVSAITLAVITRVSCPVLVVPARVPTHPPRRMLMPLEGTVESSHAVAATLWRALHDELDVIVLHVHEPAKVPAFADHAHLAHRAWDDEFLARFAAPARRKVSLLRNVGFAEDNLTQVAQEAGADLIALGWSQRLQAGHAPVVRAALAQHALPVLLIPVA